MEYAIVIFLTLLLSWSIISIIAKHKKLKKIIHRQSDMHIILKKFFNMPLQTERIITSQNDKRKEITKVKVMIIDQKAYWIANNTFYTADTVDGEVKIETAAPIDTSNMSTKDVNKMLFILDNLNRKGKINDSGSTRDERF